MAIEFTNVTWVLSFIRILAVVVFVNCSSWELFLGGSKDPFFLNGKSVQISTLGMEGSYIVGVGYYLFFYV